MSTEQPKRGTVQPSGTSFIETLADQSWKDVFIFAFFLHFVYAIWRDAAFDAAGVLLITAFSVVMSWFARRWIRRKEAGQASGQASNGGEA